MAKRKINQTARKTKKRKDENLNYIVDEGKLCVAVQNVCQESLKEALHSKTLEWNGDLFYLANQSLQPEELSCSYVFPGTKLSTGAPEGDQPTKGAKKKKENYSLMNDRCVIAKTLHVFWDKLVILYYESRVKGTSADSPFFVQCMKVLKKAHEKKGGNCVRPDQIRCNKDKSVLNKKNYPFLIEKYIPPRVVLLAKLLATTSNWKTVDQFIDEINNSFGKECSLYVKEKIKEETGILEILNERKDKMEGYKPDDFNVQIYEETLASDVREYTGNGQRNRQVPAVENENHDEVIEIPTNHQNSTTRVDESDKCKAMELSTVPTYNFVHNPYDVYLSPKGLLAYSAHKNLFFWDVEKILRKLWLTGKNKEEKKLISKRSINEEEFWNMIKGVMKEETTKNAAEIFLNSLKNFPGELPQLAPLFYFKKEVEKVCRICQHSSEDIYLQYFINLDYAYDIMSRISISMGAARLTTCTNPSCDSDAYVADEHTRYRSDKEMRYLIIKPHRIGYPSYFDNFICAGCEWEFYLAITDKSIYTKDDDFVVTDQKGVPQILDVELVIYRRLR